MNPELKYTKSALRKLATIRQTGAGHLIYGKTPFDGDTRRMVDVEELRSIAIHALNLIENKEGK